MSVEDRVYTLVEAKQRFRHKPCRSAKGHSYGIIETDQHRPRFLVCSRCGEGWRVKRGSQGARA